MQGISTVVVIILIVLITVGFTALGYFFFSGILTVATKAAGNMTETTVAGMTSQMKIESVSGKDIYVRNIGLAELSGFNVYVNDVGVSYTIDKSPLRPGEVAKINLTNAPSGTIKITAAPIAIATYTAPASPTCPDGTCAVGENCPADVSACLEPAVCRYRTCDNGCNNPAGYIASGSQDTEGSNLCNNTVGCASPPCVCNGAGGCISSGDTTPPTWSYPQSFAPSTYSPTTRSEFNITWTDNIGISKVLTEMNYSGINNYSMTNSYGGNKYNYSIILPAGTFYWKSYANDTSNNWNSSTMSTFTTSKASIGVNLYLNGTLNSNRTYTYPESVNATATSSVLTPSLYRDGVYKGTNEQILLGNGTYAYKVNATGNQNYSDNSTGLTYYAFVNKGSSTVYLYVDSARASKSVSQYAIVNYTSQLITPTAGNVELWTNYSDGVWKQWKGPQASPLINLTNMTVTGVWNWTANYTGNQNYSGKIDSFIVTVTTVADTTKPTWLNLGVNNSNPAEGNGVLMYSQWNDNVQLDKYIFSWNATGTDCGATSGWQNESWTDFQTNNWTNTSKTIPTGCAGKTVGFRFYGRDTSLNENVTDIATFTVQSAGGEVVNMVELLTGLTKSAWGSGSTEPSDPYNTYYHDNRAQAIYLVTELQAAGIPSGAKIIGISLNVNQQPSRDLANFRVRLQHTVSTTSTSWVTAGWTLTYGPTTIPFANLIAGNWYNHTFLTNFTWDGTSNLLIDLTRDDTAYIAGGGMYKRDGLTNRMCTCYHDSSYTWPFDGCTATVKNFVPAIKIIYVTST